MLFNFSIIKLFILYNDFYVTDFSLFTYTRLNTLLKNIPSLVVISLLSLTFLGRLLALFLLFCFFKRDYFFNFFNDGWFIIISIYILHSLLINLLNFIFSIFLNFLSHVENFLILAYKGLLN